MEKDGDIWGPLPEKEPLKKSGGVKPKVRSVPDFYILPRRSIPKTIALYTFLTIAGVGAGMLIEQWINIRIANDTAVLFRKDTDLDKKDS